MRRTAALSTVVLALLALTAAPALGWSDWEGSNRPQDIFTEVVDDTFFDGFLSGHCDARIETHVEGKIRTRWTFNRGLGIQFDTHTWMLHGTATNLDTGDSINFVESGSDRLAFEVLHNGDYTGVVTIYQTRHLKVTVPGVGLVASSNGREIVAEVWKVIDQESFDWEFVSSDLRFQANAPMEDWDAICGALTASE